MAELAALTEDAATGELVARAAGNDEAAIRAIMRRYNGRLYRLARSVLKHDADAEDAVQQAYVKAFSGIGSFRGDAELGTWLSRIVINVALDEHRRRRPMVDLSELNETADDGGSGSVVRFPGAAVDPERSLAQRQIQGLVEQAIDGLPEAFRTVLVARVVEGLSVEETAALLDLKPETVKTRLHRARRLLRDALEAQVGPALTGVFPFNGWRCDRLADRVIAALKAR